MLLNWFEPEYGSVLPEMLILTVLALIISSIGFYRVVYFISIGYAFSIVAMAVMSPVRHFENLAWTSALQNILLGAVGSEIGHLPRSTRIPGFLSQRTCGYSSAFCGNELDYKNLNLGECIGVVCSYVFAESVQSDHFAS